MSAAQKSGPLVGLQVVEMTGLGPAPMAGQLLADLGAHVTVIDKRAGERIDKDVNRRGKKSIALNMKNEEAVKVFFSLITNADILLEGFRPGVMERLGLGPDVCLQKNPRLIYGRMTGWGQEGPLSHCAGHDLNYLAMTGMLHAIGEAGRAPVPPLNIAADYGGGSMFLLLGVLSALFERSQSGKGQVIDAAMVDGVPAMLGLIYSMLGSGLWQDKRQDNLLDGGAPFYRCYETSDGRYLSVGALEPQFFALLLEGLCLPAEFSRKQMNRQEWPALEEAIGNAIKAKTLDHWSAVFVGTDACVAPVLSIEEANAAALNTERGNRIRLNGITQAAPAPRFSRSQPDTPSPANRTGEHNSQVLQELGFTLDDIKHMQEKQVLA
ncbi:E-cinnamoyl-CoA:R-phenyllactate CoA transferase [Pseudovibrio axinellae]|uniref:E-cinnamoyl-CoA:R-phenyllactate CoA transferase n=1 Tax=Pseudovibrio axinellae TaxID=989403 RepID=A0A165XIC5_9HYPH|nr:CaiB/BaiF CoA-transferase family protein [Pseudovibrio axinellae]KZL17729.1 E-cinnamoyl-CoA:R-phenyllactate CoA transferase [Pseudovibrio axinellae]SER42062.1 alpha-methylacyl-CoA racemase [Pseudovibrio axinellae]